MKRIIELAGVDIPASSLPNVTRTPEGIAMAHVPGWEVLIDPDYVAAGALQNRAKPKAFTTTDFGTLAFTTFPGGVAAIDTAAASIRVGNLPAMTPDAWSFFAVTRPVAAGGSTYDVARSETDAVGPDLSLRMGLNASGSKSVIYEGSGTTRLAYEPAVTFLGRTVLLMYTFSTRDGLRIFENGVEVASAPTDKRPLTAGFSAGEWQMYRVNRGSLGMAGALSVDLGQAENAGYRRAMETFLMGKYGIL